MLLSLFYLLLALLPSPCPVIAQDVTAATIAVPWPGGGAQWYATGPVTATLTIHPVTETALLPSFAPLVRGSTDPAAITYIVTSAAPVTIYACADGALPPRFWVPLVRGT